MSQADHKNENLEHFENKPIKFFGLEWVSVAPLPLYGFFPSSTMLMFFGSWIIFIAVLSFGLKIQLMDFIKIKIARAKGKVCHSRIKNNR